MAEPAPLYHGTARRLVRGAIVTPAATRDGAMVWPDASNPDYAYASKHIADAADFAECASDALRAGGRYLPPRVYRVEPVGVVTPDTDGDLLRSVRTPHGFVVVDWIPQRAWQRARRDRDRTVLHVD